MKNVAISTYVPPDRLPPHSIQTEVETLGACMLPGCDVASVVEAVKAEDFYRSAHQEIFAAIKQLHANGDAIDHLTVYEILSRSGSDVNDVELMRILGQTPHAANAAYHASIVAQRAVSRNILRIAEETRAFVYSERFTSDELVSHLQTQVGTLSTTGVKMNFADAPEMLDDFFAEIAAVEEGDRPKVYTGIREVDDLIGGFEGGQLVIIGARTSVGKSVLCTQIFEQVTCDQDKHALMFSLEVSHRRLMAKIVPSRARVSRSRLKHRRTTPDDDRRMAHVLPEIRKANFRADKSFLRGYEAIISASKQYNLKNPGKLACVIVDYLQLMTTDEIAGRANKQRHEYIGDCTRKLKLLAEELNIPVVVAAQVNRDAEKMGDGRPKLYHLRESGSIEMDADIVILIHRPDKDTEGLSVENSEMNVAKNRDGECGTIMVKFKRWCTRFVSMEEPEHYDPSNPTPF